MIFLQPDLGSTLVFPPIAFSLLYIARMPAKFFVSTFVVFVVMLSVLDFVFIIIINIKPKISTEAVVAYEDTSLLPLKDYQRKRILTFIAPEVEDPHGIGANWNGILMAVTLVKFQEKGWVKVCRRN